MTDQSQSDSDAIQSREDTDGADMIVSPPRVARRARWAAITFMVMLGFYAVLGVLARHYAYFEWDLVLARSIQSISVRGFAPSMTAVSFLGGWMGWVLVVISGLGFLKKGLRAEAVICTAGPALGSLMNLLLKALIGRPRPTDLLVHVARVYRHESFPSGHVVFFVEFFGFLFFLSYVLLERGRLRPAILIALGLLIALVGVSRVYLGAHWPSDVLGAYLAGGIWLVFMILIYNRIKARQLRAGDSTVTGK